MKKPNMLDTKYLQKHIDNIKSVVDLFSDLMTKKSMSEEDILKAMSYALSFRGYISYVEDELSYIKNEMTTTLAVRQLNPSTDIGDLFKKTGYDDILDQEISSEDEDDKLISFVDFKNKNKNNKPN